MSLELAIREQQKLALTSYQQLFSGYNFSDAFASEPMSYSYESSNRYYGEKLVEPSIEAVEQRLNPFQVSTPTFTMESVVFGEFKQFASQSISEALKSVDVKPRWELLETFERVPSKSPNLEEQSGPESFARVRRMVERRKANLDDERFKVLQKWEGKVTVVEDGRFYADLKNLTAPTADEEVELDLEEIFPDDRELVEVGSSFYWSVGYVYKSHGQQIRASEIRFKRIPGWTEGEIARANSNARALSSLFNLDCGASEA